jgi:2-C-methyl-D-erythritol 4-phosphate cytidylyltransferase
MQVDAVIVAAGSSSRFGSDKLFADVLGRPLIAWTLAAFEAAESAARLVVVTSATDAIQGIAQEFAPTKFAACVPGGERRRDSVAAGLRACGHARYVAIHDGARPLISPALVDRCVAAAEGKAGAIVAVPATDTIKEVDGGLVTGHPERSRLWAAQTPQVVLRQAWLDAAAAGDDDETDDAAMLARLGLECTVVEGDFENLKVTRPLDLEVVRLIAAQRESR